MQNRDAAAREGARDTARIYCFSESELREIAVKIKNGELSDSLRILAERQIAEMHSRDSLRIVIEGNLELEKQKSDSLTAQLHDGVIRLDKEVERQKRNSRKKNIIIGGSAGANVLLLLLLLL
jgi:signal transduction histidine kinase